MHARTGPADGLRERDPSAGRAMDDVLPELLRPIGGRPLLGYYIDFDARLPNKYVRRRIGTHLPNGRIEISRLYHDRKYGDAPPLTSHDLRSLAIPRDLRPSLLRQHDAAMSATMCLQLRDMRARGVRLPRDRTPSAVAAAVGG